MNASNSNAQPEIFVSCRRATEILSKSHDAPLTSRERFALRLHLLICSWCRRYKKQIAVMRTALRRRAAGDDTAGPALSSEARERIRRALRQ